MSSASFSSKSRLSPAAVASSFCTAAFCTSNFGMFSSAAALAADLRRKTYKMVQEGKSEEYVLDYMSQRYGDFVLYRPRMQTNTVLLWVGPFIILLIGIFVLMRFIRRKPPAAEAILTDADRSRAEQLLEKEK